jgi:hypothetical protein
MNKAQDFVKTWFLENYDSEGYPDQPGEEHYQAKTMAAQCIIAAEAVGISECDLKAELGNIEVYIRAEIEEAVGRA